MSSPPSNQTPMPPDDKGSSTEEFKKEILAAGTAKESIDLYSVKSPAASSFDNTSTQLQQPSDLASSQLRSKAPRQATGYKILEPLGAGTYGEVWLAEEERTGIRVAIKFFAHGAGLQWQLLQAEVKQLAQLHSDPGIVQLLDVEPDAAPPYYVMAHAKQGSLSRRIEKGPLPVDEALAIFRQVAEALAYVHAKGIRHCDLKPGNVLLDGRGRALVADFGQAHLSSDCSPALGTFFYMAPEQADLNEQIPDTRWDVYGLGALLYTMLTGRPPRSDSTLHQQLAGTLDLSHRLDLYRKSIQQAPPLTGHRSVPGVDKALAAIIDGCLRINPDERFRDAAAVLAALDARERKKRQRPALVFGLVAPMVLLLVMASVGFIIYDRAKEGAFETQRRMDEKIQQRNQFIAELVVHDIEERLTEYVMQVEALAQQPALVAALRQRKTGPMTPLMKEANAPLKEPPHYVWITATDGIILDILPKVSFPPKSYAWRDWFNGKGEDQADGAAFPPVTKTYISQPFVAKADKRLMVALTTPVRDPQDNDKIVGVVTSTILVQTLCGWIKKLDVGHDFAVMINERGQYLAHQHEDAIVPAPRPVSVPKDSVLKKEVLAKRTPGFTEEAFQDPIDGKTYRGCYAPMKNRDIGWIVLIQQDQSQVSPALELTQMLFRISVIGLVVVGLLIPLLWGWLLWMLRRGEGPIDA